MNKIIVKTILRDVGRSYNSGGQVVVGIITLDLLAPDPFKIMLSKY